MSYWLGKSPRLRPIKNLGRKPGKSRQLWSKGLVEVEGWC